MKTIKRLFSIKNIQTKLFIFFILLILLIISSISVVIYLNQKNTLVDQAKEKAFSHTKTLAYSSLNAILIDEYITLQLLIDSMSDGKDILAITIINTQGNIIAANEPELRGTLLNDEMTRKAILSSTFLLQKCEKDIWDTAVPIFKLEERIGTARIKFSVDDTYAGLQQTIFIIGFIALLISLLLSYVLSKRFTKPIHQAIELATEYGKGNLEASVEVYGDDEIGRLIQSLNLLSGNLKQVIDEKVSLENLAMIGEFSSYIMHDLKNPIVGVSM
ncbi:MAG: HAMP domain-containing protein, partial [Promethearchaeota archaeon]